MFSYQEALAITIALSVLSGTGVFLLGVREQRIHASLFNFITELVLALIAGMTGFYIAKNRGWEESLMFIAVLVASNNWREFSNAAKNRLLEFILGANHGGKKEDDDERH